MLSRQPDANKGEENNQDLVLLPPETFICVTTVDVPTLVNKTTALLREFSIA